MVHIASSSLGMYWSVVIDVDGIVTIQKVAKYRIANHGEISTVSVCMFIIGQWQVKGESPTWLLGSRLFQVLRIDLKTWKWECTHLLGNARQTHPTQRVKASECWVQVVYHHISQSKGGVKVIIIPKWTEEGQHTDSNEDRFPTKYLYKKNR